MPRGGKRPGAGAPKGNMNNLKHGLYSKQFAQVGALLAADPKIRETLLAIGEKHNFRRQRANENAALLFTRLYQHAKDIANKGAQNSPSPAKRERGPGGEGNPFILGEAAASVTVDTPVVSAPAGAVERLNLTLPVDDLDSITRAAARAARRNLRAAIRRAAHRLRENENEANVNQTPDTSPESQSDSTS